MRQARTTYATGDASSDYPHWRRVFNAAESQMAANPRTRRRTLPPGTLAPFTPVHAERVMSWVTSAQEAYWIAPRTRPPLTAREVLNWQVPGHSAFLLFAPNVADPIGYGELNILTGALRRFWLGHLIVDPAQRGRGYGVQLTRLLLREALIRRAAHDVTLVVFPENRGAIACYQAAGMRITGYEMHEFPAYNQRVRLVRMEARTPPK